MGKINDTLVNNKEKNSLVWSKCLNTIVRKILMNLKCFCKFYRGIQLLLRTNTPTIIDITLLD